MDDVDTRNRAASKPSAAGRDLSAVQRSDAGVEELAIVRCVAGRLIERAAELAKLEDLLRAASEGKPRFVQIVGEAGIGKSRLVHELRARSESAGIVHLSGACDEYGAGGPFEPWGSLVKQLLDVIPGAAACWRGGAVLSALNEPYAAGGSGLVDPERLQLFETVRELFAEAARERTVVLLVEDVHWCGRSSIRLLELLVRQARDERLLTVVTVRSGETRPDHASLLVVDALTQGPTGASIQLSGLSEVGLSRLLEDRFGLELEREALRSLERFTRGSPLLALGAAAHLTDPTAARRDLVRSGSVRDVVLRTLGDVDARCVAVLKLASVLGFRFDASSIARLAEACGLSAAAVLESLDVGVAARLLVSVGAETYEFRHALVARALYLELGEQRRAALCRAAGPVSEWRSAEGEPPPAPVTRPFELGLPAGRLERAAVVATLRKDVANSWLVGFGTECARISDSGGLRVLAHLVRRPGEPVTAVKLASVAGRPLAGDEEPAVRERARVNITRSVKRALLRIEIELPELGRHLTRTVSTGASCTYLPDPRQNVRWDEPKSGDPG